MSEQYNVKLAKMAEQIVANMSFSDDEELIADKVADHMQRFWGPGMREALLEHARTEEPSLTPALRRALHKVAANLNRA